MRSSGRRLHPKANTTSRPGFAKGSCDQRPRVPDGRAEPPAQTRYGVGQATDTMTAKLANPSHLSRHPGPLRLQRGHSSGFASKSRSNLRSAAEDACRPAVRLNFMHEDASVRRVRESPYAKTAPPPIGPSTGSRPISVVIRSIRSASLRIRYCGEPSFGGSLATMT